MYNRYLSMQPPLDPPEYPIHNGDAPPDAAQTASAGTTRGSNTFSSLSGLSQLLGSRLQNIRLDMDTIVTLAIVWFLLSDGAELDTELFLLIGALLVLGV